MSLARRLIVARALWQNRQENRRPAGEDRKYLRVKLKSEIRSEKSVRP